MAHVLTKLTVVPKNDCAEAAALAKELGLDLQAKRYEKPLAENVFTPLSDDERIVWENYCPTRYVPGGVGELRALEQYAFDSVPIEVMRHWKAIKDNYAFDRYEIWTTERRPQAADPLLIGYIGQKVYLLARWGLESPESMPLKAVAKAVAQRLWDNNGGYWRRTESFGFLGFSARYTGDLRIEQMDVPFKAACRIAGWTPNLT